jgi:hypothetical protein
VAKTQTGEPESALVQPSEVLSGLEAVTRTERVICHDAVTREPAVAEGLALAGARATSIADATTAGVAGTVALTGSSCVHHVSGAGHQAHAGAFELAARSVQEAADQCLAAHLLSQKLGRAGACSLAPDLVDRLGVVALPDAAVAAALLDTGDQEAERDAGPERVLELARAALQATGERTGRSADPVEYRGDAGAELVLVASGAAATAAEQVARILSRGGLAAGVLSLVLVRPFPMSAVQEGLAGARRVFVLGEPAQRGAFLAHVRAAAADDAEIFPLPGGAPEQLLEALVARLPEGVFDAKQHAPGAEEPSRRLVLAPAGPWSEQMARQVGAALAQLGPLQLGPHTRIEAGATVLAWDDEAVPQTPGDLLLAAEPSLLEPDGALALVRPGSTALVVSEAETSELLAQSLSQESRSAILERELAVHWATPPESQDLDGLQSEANGRAASLYLTGASLAALLGPGKQDAIEAAGAGAEARWLREGAEAVRSLDAKSLDPARHVKELDFRPALSVPRMPTPEDDADRRAGWARRIWRFHVSGSAPGAAPHLPLRTAALGSLMQDLRQESPHPFVLVRSEGAEQPIAARRLRELLGAAIENMQAAGRPARVLEDNLGRLVTLAARELGQGEAEVALEPLLSGAGQQLAAELALSEDEGRALVDDLGELGRVLPADATVLDLRADSGMPLSLYLKVIDAVCASGRQEFIEELGWLCERLRDLLQLDRMASGEARSPEALAAALGSAASQYVDTAALAQTLPVGTRSAELGEERRRRVEWALATLERQLERREELSRVIVVRAPGADPAPAGTEQHQHRDPLAAAMGLFDGVSWNMAEVFRAARTARLEAEARYRPELHDRVLAELNWEAFTGAELDLVPKVVVMISGQRLRRRDQVSLSELVGSSRPVQVLVEDQEFAAEEAESLSRFHVDLGHVVVAHREAFAVGSTPARPERLVEGLVRMVRARRPALALLQLPPAAPAILRPLLAEAALRGRACRDFLYDPDAGESWADRFDLAGNPDPERAWPIQRVSYVEDGEALALELEFTFADAVALEPAYLRHLLVVPPVAWDESQQPLAEYLEQFDAEGPERRVPFLWVVDADGVLQRAIVTRELALASRDRLRGWRAVQELGGYRNVFAERAGETAREQAQAEAAEQIAALEQAHAEELERLRSEAGRESMERLAAVLISADGIPAMGAPAPAPAAPPPPAEAVEEEAVAEAAPVEEVEEEEAISFDEPYIDTPLCTTCNECTNLNAQLFHYNAEKQAYIADPAAGTFAELVKAAELCPAKCIHPGKPRDGDSTATPELIERAAKFN